MRAPLGLTMLCAVFLSACRSTSPVQTTFERPYPERNGAGDPIVAIYVGRIPCAVQSCEMRKVELVLYGREAGRVPTTYWLGQVGVGESNERVVREGTWSVRRGVVDYPQGLVYVLDANADPTLEYLWRVNDEVGLVLNEDMRPKTGNAAWGFMLSRDCAPYGPRSYPYDQRARRFIAAPTKQTACSKLLSPEG